MEPLEARQTITILAVSDPARAARFYREAFGWRPRVELPIYVELEVPGGPALSLYQREGFAANTGVRPEPVAPGAISGTELYFRVSDLAAACARLEAAGGRLLSAPAPRPWGDLAAYYADPDGNVVAVFRPLDDD